MLFAVETGGQFIRTEFDFFVGRPLLRTEGDRELSVDRRRVLLDTPATGSDEFAPNGSAKNQVLPGAEMAQVHLQGGRQVVCGLAIFGKGPIEFGHLFYKLEFCRRGFNVINRNSHILCRRPDAGAW